MQICSVSTCLLFVVVCLFVCQCAESPVKEDWGFHNGKRKNETWS